MKNKLFWLILVLAICAIIFSLLKEPTKDNIDFKPLELNVGDEFTNIDYDNKMYVLNYIVKDVTGDGTNDMIIVVGEKEKVDDLLANNMDLVIYEPNEGSFYNLKLKKMNGEMPKLETYELTGDDVLDVVLTANDINGNLNIRIASMDHGDFKEILKAKDNRGIVFSGQFVDGFKTNVKNNKYAKEAIIDLSDRKENYITSGFYDESGRLLKIDSKITTSNFVKLEYVQLDGYYGLQTTQRILGFNNEDVLDEITVIWKYEKGKWVVKEAKGNNIGNILY
ncbi:MAG: hypothetical protein IJ220_08660 [Clostridia bacterium]|nr:hypothetical protein [Clostridia bacterium]